MLNPDLLASIEARLSLRVGRNVTLSLSSLDSEPALMVNCGDYQERHYLAETFPIRLAWISQLTRRLRRRTAEEPFDA